MLNNKISEFIIIFLAVLSLQSCAATGNDDLSSTGLFQSGPGNGSELPMVHTITLSHAFNIGVAGGAGSGIGEFTFPSSVAFTPTGSLVVADLINDRAERWSLDFASASANFQFNDVTGLAFAGLAFSSSGIGYYGETDTDKVIVRAENGTTSNFSVDGTPQGLAVDSNGLVYVGNLKVEFNYLQVLSAAGVEQFDVTSSVDGEEFGKPRFVAVGPNSEYLVISDNVDHNVYIFKASGASWVHYQTLGQSVASSEVGGFDTPAGVAMDSDLVLFVADQKNHRVVAYRHNARLERWEIIASHIFGSNGTEDGQFDRPIDLAVYEDGTRRILSVADAINTRVSVFTYSLGLTVE